MRIVSSAALAAVVAMATACAHGRALGTAGTPRAGYHLIAERLRASGADVRVSGRAEERFMPVAAVLLTVDGARVEVFDLADEASARAHAARIAPDASQVGSERVAWVASPHFYRAGCSIVLYLGDDPRLLARLDAALGAPIARGVAGPKPDDAPVEDDVPTIRV